MGNDGEPNPENYIIDGLHLNKQGYEIWREIIRTQLASELGDFSGVIGSSPSA
jgi:lysophospholipase L1-like esterase